jgi:hypothetical protein
MAMKLFVDISLVQFTVTREAQDKLDDKGRQKADRVSGELLWTVQVMALDSRDERGGEILNVTVAGQPPKVAMGQPVSLSELEAIPWATNGRSGVAFKAKSITPKQAAKAA